MSIIERILAEQRSMTPTTGFNVVGVDRFEIPGEAAYVVSNHATRADAEIVAGRMKRENAADDFHVYEAEPRAVPTGAVRRRPRGPASRR